MQVNDFLNNPKRLALLLEAYSQMETVIEYCADRIADADAENNEGKYWRAVGLLQIEMDYPNKSWSKLEFEDSEEGESKAVDSIPDERGLLSIYDADGECNEYWI